MKTINTKSIRAAILLAGAFLTASAFMSCSNNYDDDEPETVQLAGCPKAPEALTIAEHTDDVDFDTLAKDLELTGCPKATETAAPEEAPAVVKETKENKCTVITIEFVKTERGFQKHSPRHNGKKGDPDFGRHNDFETKF